MTQNKLNWTAEEQRQHREEWVDALRSGEFEQATNTLREDYGHGEWDHDEQQYVRVHSYGYCCLGVACEISGLSEFDEGGCYINEEAVLPEDVRDWLGLADSNGSFIERNKKTGQLKHNDLTTVNDDGASFAEIADIIESVPDELLR